MGILDSLVYIDVKSTVKSLVMCGESCVEAKWVEFKLFKDNKQTAHGFVFQHSSLLKKHISCMPNNTISGLRGSPIPNQ